MRRQTSRLGCHGVGRSASEMRRGTTHFQYIFTIQNRNANKNNDLWQANFSVVPKIAMWTFVCDTSDILQTSATVPHDYSLQNPSLGHINRHMTLYCKTQGRNSSRRFHWSNSTKWTECKHINNNVHYSWRIWNWTELKLRSIQNEVDEAKVYKLFRPW